MTIQLNKEDRIYKIIEAKTFDNQRKRFISKIDKNGKVSILTYIFSADDIKEDGTIKHEDKGMMLSIKEVDKKQFMDIVNINKKIYPQFQILWEKDYSNKSLEDAIELLNIENIISTDIPIKKLIKEIKNIRK